MGHRGRGAHVRCPRWGCPCKNVPLHGESGTTRAPGSLCLQAATCITHFLSSSQCTAGGPSRQPHTATLHKDLERATKLLHITPALLQSSDGRCSRQGRYNEYAREKLAGLSDWLVVFAGRSRQKAREDTPEARQLRASKLAHERGGITKAASALVSPPAAPQDAQTLAILRSKHSSEDFARIAAGKAETKQRARIERVTE